jgi:hypothetical protein
VVVLPVALGKDAGIASKRENWRMGWILFTIGLGALLNRSWIGVLVTVAAAALWFLEAHGVGDARY